MRKFTVVLLMALLSGGLGAFFEKSKSQQAKEYAQDAKDKVFNMAGVPDSKLGELYHQGAAKVDQLLGDKYNQRRHEALVAAKRINEHVGEAYENAEPKLEAMYEKVKEWTGLAGEKAVEAKDYAYDKAGVPNTKVGEIYHQGAARVNDLIGNEMNARRHEALVAAKRMNDDPSNVVHNVKPLAKGVFGQLKEWTGLASEKAVEGKDKMLDMAGVPDSRMGEMYHQSAAKVDQLLGDKYNQRKHEALIAAKRINDDPTEILSYAKEGAVKLKNTSFMSRFGFKTIIMLALICGGLYFLFGRSNDTVKGKAHKAKGKLHEAKGEAEEIKGKAKGKISQLIAKIMEKGKELLGMGKEKFEEMRHTTKSKGQEIADKTHGKFNEVQGEAEEHKENAKSKIMETAEHAKEKGKEVLEKGKEKFEEVKHTVKSKGQEFADKTNRKLNEVHGETEHDKENANFNVNMERGEHGNTKHTVNHKGQEIAKGKEGGVREPRDHLVNARVH